MSSVSLGLQLVHPTHTTNDWLTANGTVMVSKWLPQCQRSFSWKSNNNNKNNGWYHKRYYHIKANDDKWSRAYATLQESYFTNILAQHPTDTQHTH